MKKLLIMVFITVIASANCKAQDRVDSKPATLSYKSKEITSALFWEKNSKTGRWENRKNTKLIHLGEGVAIDNFNSLFLGKFEEQQYLFLDFKEYSWRYPELKMEWMISRTIMAALVSDDDYSLLSTLNVGETLTITPSFYDKMFKGHTEYSFPFFLSLVETLRSSTETLYESNKKAYGAEYAGRQWKEDYPFINFMVIKRVVTSDGQDVVRFILYPHALQELIDSMYFEVEYTIYRNLFTEDKSPSYK